MPPSTGGRAGRRSTVVHRLVSSSSRSSPLRAGLPRPSPASTSHRAGSGSALSRRTASMPRASMQLMRELSSRRSQRMFAVSKPPLAISERGLVQRTPAEPRRRALANAWRPGEPASSESGDERAGPPSGLARSAQAAGLTGRACTTTAVAASANSTAKQRTPGGRASRSGSEEAASTAPRVPARAPPRTFSLSLSLSLSPREHHRARSHSHSLP